ncbi:MAG: hypothetical protein ABI193_02400 [Minicystis sp.]
MLTRPLLAASFVMASSLALFGCDPGAPGVQGQAVLALPIDTAKFQNLEMRAVAMPDAEDFDVTAPVFPDRVIETNPSSNDNGSLSWSGTIEDGSNEGTSFYQGDMAVKGATFPAEYVLGGEGIGYTSEEHWRLFVWLSEDAESSHLEKRPAGGAPYGVIDFDAAGCGMIGGYCGSTAGVNVLIDQIAP